MKKKQLKGSLMLFIAAFVWGSSFVSQAVGMESIESFTFNSIRMMLGALTLIPVIAVKDVFASKKPDFDKAAYKKEFIKSVKSGVIIGLILCVASNTQQYAFYYSTPGKIAFITAFYMFLVPIAGLFFGKKVKPVIWLCVAMGVVGLYLLCIGPEGLGSVNKGDIITLGCAVCYTAHIISIEKFSGNTDPVKISAVQFFTTSVISAIPMLILETPTIEGIKAATIPLLYSGIMSCSVAFTFQVVGQKYTEPTIASLLMCLESVFGVLCSAVLLRQVPTGREIAGCAVMFIAIVISQVADFIKFPQLKKKKT